MYPQWSLTFRISALHYSTLKIRESKRNFHDAAATRDLNVIGCIFYPCSLVATREQQKNAHAFRKLLFPLSFAQNFLGGWGTFISFFSRKMNAQSYDKSDLLLKIFMT